MGNRKASLLDRHITKDAAQWGGYLHMSLVQAERKIPPSLFRAECRMEELARQEVEGAHFLPAWTRAEIKRAVHERLLPQMPPTLREVTFVGHMASPVIYADALSEKQVDLFVLAFAHTLQVQPIPLTPESVALWRRKIDVRDLPPVVFSEEASETSGDYETGMDFLTWLLFASESRGGCFEITGVGELAVLVEGPLTFFREGDDAHEIVLRKGDPVFSREAKTALLTGKKLRRAKTTLSRGNEGWQADVEAREFVFRGLKMPDTHALDPLTRSRIECACLTPFRKCFGVCSNCFWMNENSAKAWQKTRKEVYRWLQERGSK